ncbi:hypothetical protein LUZ60_012067 [Juncus effusus]|nr:hypothetical protein LUZ60_012067 [Juncus effusus]
MEEASSSNSVTCAGTWSREQEKVFENALATHGENWEELAAAVEGKSLEEIKKHYELLVEDVDRIEAGRVQLPAYLAGQESGEGGEGGSKKDRESTGGKGSRSEQERRKGIAWTEDEHRLFLRGLDKYGKGDWRSISRNFVISRTPTQVASHAQKYFIRLNSMNKERRRSSIHDITSVNNNSNTITAEPIPSSQPITGTGQGIGLGSSSSSSKPPGGAKPGSVVVGTSMPVPINYGTTTIGQPVAPAVGTPVTVPPHLPYGSVVPGAPVAYPMPPNTSHPHPHHSHR